MAEAELLDEVYGGKAGQGFHLLIECGARESHLGGHLVDIELAVGDVLADDVVQAVDELVAGVGLGGQTGQSLADVYLVAHAGHLQHGADDEPGDERGDGQIDEAGPPRGPPGGQDVDGQTR